MRGYHKILFLVLYLMVICISSAAAEERYCSILDIREEGDELLKESDGAGRIEIITVRGTYPVLVEIPDAEQVPVIAVTHPEYDQIPNAPDGGDIDVDAAGDELIGWTISVNQESLYGEFVKNTARTGKYDMDAIADGSPMTMADAISFADRILLAYSVQGWDYRLHRHYARSRRYRAVSGRDGFNADMEKPVDDTGYYTLEYEQIFHGIPYRNAVIFPYPGKDERKASSYEGLCRFDIFSPECYAYMLHAAAETEILAEDVPLCSLQKVFRALEHSCVNHSGTPAYLRFVYKAWVNPADKEGDLILLPVWILESDDGFQNHGDELAVVNAQTGELIDENRRDQHRYDAIWIE